MGEGDAVPDRSKKKHKRDRKKMNGGDVF